MAEAASPDPDRALTEVAASMAEWVVHLLARLILLLRGQSVAAAHRRVPAVPAWCPEHPDQPRSVQALAASVRGGFGHAAAWVWRRGGINRRRADWPALAGTIPAFAGRLLSDAVPFRAGAACNGEIARTSCPAWIGMRAASSPADPVMMFLSPETDGHVPPPPLAVAPAGPYRRCDRQTDWH